MCEVFAVVRNTPLFWLRFDTTIGLVERVSKEPHRVAKPGWKYVHPLQRVTAKILHHAVYLQDVDRLRPNETVSA